MYFSRGNPVIYYGDEQGFTGTGGDQVARQTMFASQVPDYLDDDLLGTDEHPRRGQLRDRAIRCTQKIKELAALTKAHPALRNGAHQHRYASDRGRHLRVLAAAPGQQVEYVVALNNSESAQTAAIPTYVAQRRLPAVYGSGPQYLTLERRAGACR